MIFFCPVFTAETCPKCQGTGVTQEEALNMCSSSSSSETCSFQSAVCAVKDVLGDDNSHGITRSCMSAMSFDAETSFPRQNARCEQLVANHSAGKCVMGKCESDNCKAQLPALVCIMKFKCENFYSASCKIYKFFKYRKFYLLRYLKYGNLFIMNFI